MTKMHDHPSKMPLVSQRISEILASISTSDKQTFLSLWMNKIFRISTSGMTSPASYRTHHSRNLEWLENMMRHYG